MSGSGGYQVPTGNDRLRARIASLEAAVSDAQKRPFRVPTLQGDPDPADQTNLWYLDDGRLRGRIRDGTIVEYSRSNHTHPSVAANPQGGVVSTAPAPPPPYVPATHVYDSDADWGQTYDQGGASQRAQDGWLYYGRITSVHNEQKAMLHFPGLAAALAPGPAGTRTTNVTLRIVNQWTFSNGGGELRIGIHNSATAPGSFTQTRWDPFRVHVAKSGYPASGAADQTFTLPNWVGDMARDGALQGFTFDQQSASSGSYGYARQYGHLHIEFVS